MSEMDQLLAGLETAPPATTPPATAETPEPTPETPETAAGSPDEPPEARPSLKDYAEKHSLDLKELYKLETSGGMSLSEMSDAGKDFKSLTEDRETFEAEKAESRIKTAATSERLGEYLAVLDAGQPLTDTAIAQLRSDRAGRMEAEQRQLLAVIPEWKDTTARAVDVELMVSHLAPFGFVQSDLASVADHRLIKYIHFNAQREERAKKALAGAVKPKPKGTSTVDGKGAAKGGINLEQILKGAGPNG